MIHSDKFPLADYIPLKKQSGIYIILNISNGKLYVGSAVRISNRWRQHRHDLNQGKHRNDYLQKAFNASPDSFVFSVIEYVDGPENLLSREQFWLNFYQSNNRSLGYNLNPVCGSSLGRKMTPEQRLAKSALHKGKPQPWLRKPIVKMDLDGKDLEIFHSIFEASRALGFDKPVGNLVSVMKGNQKTAYGFKWRYA